MIGIVLVSHYPALAQACTELVTALVPGMTVSLHTAAGDAEGGLGTDATAIVEAIQQADDGEGVLVLVDLGSAVMSAQTAVELCEPELAARVRLSGAPLVEGLVGAYAAAGIGRDLDGVLQAAEEAVHAKHTQLAAG